MDNTLLLVVLAGVGFYLYQKKNPAPVDLGIKPFDGNFGAVLPGSAGPGGQVLGNLGDIVGVFTDNSAANGIAGAVQSGGSIAGGIGAGLTALTGIPGFAQLGAALGPLLHNGSEEADDLVQNYQNPLLQNYLSPLIAAWNNALNTGQATRYIAEQVKAMLLDAERQFDRVASLPKFSHKGPGGIETVRHVIEDILIPDIDKQVSLRGLQ